MKNLNNLSKFGSNFKKNWKKNVMSIESILSNFSGIFYFGVVLGLAVIFHEWGHYIVAKLSGAKVDEFAVGFGKKILKYTWHNTEYTLRALPLGGFVKIRGMDPDDEITGADYEYLQLAPWKRIFIVVAGPFMNFVLAYLIYVFILFSFGQSYTASTTIGQVPHGSWGWEIGLQTGDQIVSINDRKISSWDDVESAVANIYSGIAQKPTFNHSLNVIIERDGEKLAKKKVITPEYINALISDSGTQITPPDSFTGIYVTKVIPGGAAHETGLTSGIVIESINGETFETRKEWSDYISTSYEKADDGTYSAKSMDIVYCEPESATKTVSVTPNLVKPSPDSIPNKPIAQLGIMFEGEISVLDFFTPKTPLLGVSPKLNPIIGRVQDGSPADLAGLEKDCRIVSINGKDVDDWNDVLFSIYTTPITENEDTSFTAEPLELAWLTSNNEMKEASISPNVTLQKYHYPNQFKNWQTISHIPIGNSPQKRTYSNWNSWSISRRLGTSRTSLFFYV
jgi:regulator of sigma E protease